jgi:hypothetical protein
VSQDSFISRVWMLLTWLIRLPFGWHHLFAFGTVICGSSGSNNFDDNLFKLMYRPRKIAPVSVRIRFD